MFDLEKAIRDWKKKLQSNPSLEEGFIAELEENLREEVRALARRRDMTEEEAFRHVAAEMGRADEVGAEFRKVYAPRRARREAWRASGFVPGLALSYLRVAVRRFKRQWSGTLINLSGLAAGLSVCILTSLWVGDELSYDRYLENRDRLCLLTVEHPNGVLDPNVPYALAPALARERPEIVEYTRIYKLSKLETCSFSTEPSGGARTMYYEDSVEFVDPGFFRLFTYPFVQGDPALALRDPNSLVVRDEAARKYFGDENPFGKKLNLNGRRDLVITGVIRVPANSHFRPDFITTLPDTMDADWNWRDPSYVVLDPKASPDAVSSKIEGSLNANFPRPLPGRFKVGLLPVAKIHLGFGGMAYVYIFSMAAVLVLAIACVNYMNLATARSGSRGREVALRKIVGARRGQVMRQFLSESLVTAAIAFGLALTLAWLLLPFVNNLTGKSLALLSGRGPFLLVGLLGLTILVGLVAGSYPALCLSARRPIEAFRANLNFKSRKSVFRIVSVVGQFTISVLLIACTGVVLRQLQYMRDRPLGLTTEHVLKVRYNPSLLRNFQSFKTELLHHPRILSVTRSQDVPFNDDYKTDSIEWDGKDPALQPLVRYSVTDFGFFETFGIAFAAGRGFSEDRPADRADYVINEKAAAYMDLKDPVGQRLKFWGQEGQIIGVVKDFHQVSLHREILPQVFTINPRFYRGAIKFIFVKVSGDGVAETLRAVREAAATYAPDYPFEASFLDKGAGALYVSERRLGRVFAAFAFLAVFISCLGILGLAAYGVEQRTKEIGVRKVLGASIPGIMRLLAGPFSVWIIVANAVAWPVAYIVMSRWLRGFAYRVGPGLEVFIAAGLISMVTAALPIVYQTLKAAVADPVRALRYE